jgi:hypothetical protein
MRRLLIAGSLCLLLAVPAAHAAPPPIKHVAIIVLENKDFAESFGDASPAKYLAKELTAKGQLLNQYYGTSHASLGNYISMISGQAPNPITQGDCPAGFSDVFPGVMLPADGQVLGVGCVYPAAAKTIADQLDEKKLGWKGYMQDMGNAPGAPKTCRHPAIGEVDDTQSARNGDQYAVRHNPFVYFHSIIDDQKRCDEHVVALEALSADFAKAETTPAYAFITPNLCEDGHDAPCVDGRPGGLVSSDAFLKNWVPIILGSPGFKHDGMLIVTWDEGEVSPTSAASCCAQPTGFNTPLPGIFGPGGGRTGAVVISPYVKPGSVNEQPYNHYSLLRSIEDLFGLPHLGYAGQAGLKAFGDDVYNGTPSAATTTPVTCKLAATLKGRVLTVLSPKAGKLVVKVGRRAVKTLSVKACRRARVTLPRKRSGKVSAKLDKRALHIKR